jgi:hypothetical protein
VVEGVCCLLVLDSVTSTPQWIRQPKPCGCVHDVCVFVCECVQTFPGLSASEPPVMPSPALASCHQDSQRLPTQLLPSL